MANNRVKGNDPKHELIFHHPSPKLQFNTLVVGIKPNDIQWSYGLNTANYPTYGGEVVQILSCYIEDMTVTGEVATYSKVEEIYGWFIDYIQIATHGKQGEGSFDTRPVTLQYPHRGWTFKIYPKGMPALRYGTEVVAPEWQLQAAVVDPDQAFKLQVLDHATVDALKAGADGINPFGTVTGAIGFEEDDPWRTPFVTVQNEQKQQGKGNQGPDTPGGDARGAYGELADFYNKLIPSWLNNDFSDLAANYSAPVFSKGQDTQVTASKKAVDKAVKNQTTKKQ